LKLRPLLGLILGIGSTLSAHAQTVTPVTSPQLPFKPPALSSSHHQPTLAAFYYIWYNGAWGTLLDMVPQLGEYQSSNPAVIAQHMTWLKQAGVDDIIIAWEGLNTSNGVATDANVAPVMAAANQAGIKVLFMIDEYPGRTPQTVQSDIGYLVSHYSSSPAYYTSTRVTPTFDNASVKPVFLVYYSGSDTSPNPSQWMAVNAALHKSYNAVTLVHYNYDPTWTTTGGFDGMFTYSQDSNQADRILSQSLSRHAWFISGCTPGFNALRSKGWTGIVQRNNGATYQQTQDQALDLGVNIPMVAVTSFNEWSETTQIEPCGEGTDTDGFVFQDYGSLGPDGYLTLTASFAPLVHGYEFDDYSLSQSVYTEPGNPSLDKGLWQVNWGTVSASTVTSIGGEEASTCATGAYLLNYQVAKVYGSASPASYTIRADYFDAGQKFRLAYNTTATATTHNYSTWITPGNTNTWRTAIFTVPNAVFNEMFGGNSDFRFETPSGGNFDIGVVEITKN
jgi:hypothetical protein